MVDIAGTVSKGWMADAIEVAFDRDYYFHPRQRQAIDSRCNAYLSEHLADLNLLFTESNLGQRRHYEPKQVLIGGIQPNMIIGMLLGADFVPNARMDADISPIPLAGIEPKELPPPELLLEHELIHLFEDQFHAIDADSSGDLIPIPPFFWDGSGRATIHGALTTAQKLFGDSIFLDLMTSPRRGAAILDWATDVSMALVDHFARTAGRDIAEVHVGECSACMVNAELFDRFVVPTLSRIGRELGPVRLHSCGTSDHLLKTCRRIENLGSLDVGGGTSVAAIRELLGRDLPIDIAPLVDDLLKPTLDSLLAWAENVLKHNADGPLTIGCHVETGYNLGHLRAMRERAGASSR